MDGAAGKRMMWIALVVVPFFLFSGCVSSPTIASKLDGGGIYVPEGDQFLFASEQRLQDGGLTITTFSGHRDEDRVEIQRIVGFDKSEAEEYVRMRRSMVDSLFADSFSPYPGPISEAVRCSAEYLPKIQEAQVGGMTRITYAMYATERFTYGACADDLAPYLASLSYVYCPEKNGLYEVKYFTPRDAPAEDLKAFANSLACSG